jgi:hypothetical protein
MGYFMARVQSAGLIFQLDVNFSTEPLPARPPRVAGARGGAFSLCYPLPIRQLACPGSTNKCSNESAPTP